MRRRTDWRRRLIGYLSAAARRPFAEGEHDCALFAAGGVAAMTGEDPAAAWRGRYTTTRGGIRVLRKDGYADHVAVAAALFEEVPVAHAFAGDLAVVETEGGDALGIVQGAWIYVLTARRLALVPLSAGRCAFHVPFGGE